MVEETAEDDERAEWERYYDGHASEPSGFRNDEVVGCMKHRARRHFCCQQRVESLVFCLNRDERGRSLALVWLAARTLNADAFMTAPQRSLGALIMWPLKLSKPKQGALDGPWRQLSGFLSINVLGPTNSCLRSP
ncbi:hypothetical protein [Paraburkholderia sp. MM6662-R1]|uniref:hypothetical protein n=1 Tax=Paraburkholderia sp. MM6662-R1 TaxID=2991066 RepID=UPI003D21C342